jgi:hypothetical protein
MSPLKSEQKQLLFDYCIGLTSSKENAEIEALIASNEQAAAIHSQLQAALSPLESLEPEACPDYLAERTVWRLKSAASSSRQRLEQLLAGEQSRAIGPRPRTWVGMARRLAMAAVFMIVGSALIVTFNAVTGYARYSSQRQRCQMQQSGIFQGLSNYILDNDGERPAVATAAGDPWWQVGRQGNQNHSNTRRVFLLVKQGYANPSDFLCGGNQHGELDELTPEQIETLQDFPDRRYVNYSFQIYCQRTGGGKLLYRKVIMADRNPLFETLPDDFSEPLQLRLNKRLLTINSINHRRRGQNVTFGDGRVEFLRTRLIGTDDIFTLQDTDIYQGCELPSCETDFFVVP